MPDLSSGAGWFGILAAGVAAVASVLVAIVKFREARGVVETTTGAADAENLRNQLWKLVAELKEANKDLDLRCKTLDGEVEALKKVIRDDEFDDRSNSVQGSVLARQTRERLDAIETDYERRLETLQRARESEVRLLMAHVGELEAALERGGLSPPPPRRLPPARD